MIVAVEWIMFLQLLTCYATVLYSIFAKLVLMATKFGKCLVQHSR